MSWETAKARLEANSSRVGECLLWEKATVNGYGRIKVDGKKKRAHRVVWELANGPIPEGMDVDHTCHRRHCIELSHLRLATRSQNASNRQGATSKSKLGVRNVYFYRGNYQVAVRKEGKKVIRRFKTLEEATIAAAQIRSELFGEFQGRG